MRALVGYVFGVAVGFVFGYAVAMSRARSIVSQIRRNAEQARRWRVPP